jgi:simple sugar transport system ATP-binding protein
MELDNESLVGMGTKQILRAGVGYIPEDRSLDGVVKEFTVAENLVLDMYDRAPYGNAIRLNPRAIVDNAQERVTQFDIRTPSPESTVGTLSGGNQQKVVVAREMSRPLRLMVASQPTRGVDVGSIEFIHGQIIHERDNGTAVLVVSSELDEVVGLADRVAVMYRGRILATVSPDMPREEIGLLMAGITEPQEEQP